MAPPVVSDALPAALPAIDPSALSVSQLLDADALGDMQISGMSFDEDEFMTPVSNLDLDASS